MAGITIQANGRRDNDIEGIVELTFSVDDEKFGERRTIDLMPDGQDILVRTEPHRRERSAGDSVRHV